MLISFVNFSIRLSDVIPAVHDLELVCVAKFFRSWLMGKFGHTGGDLWVHTVTLYAVELEMLPRVHVGTE